ncbi:uncharacterized protein LOC108194257 isoform X4 [Daucus carota subsp. sativus]|uniref:uncharacterized protein LOC108194257 isoform X4 n=1 Tax=Daucus carota subsp. sativus TaxID=79200 RepID=UPI00308314A1
MMTPQKEKEKNPHTHSPTMECSLKEKEKKARTHSPKMECLEKEEEMAASVMLGNVAENPVKKPVKKEKKPYTLSPPVMFAEKQVKKMESSLKEEEKPHTHSPPAASGKPVKKMESSLKEEEKPHTHSPPAASGDLAGKPVKKMESSLKEEEKPHTHSPPAASGKPVKKMESSLKEEEKPHTHSPPAATGKPVKKPPVKERLIGCFSDENFEIGEGIEKFMPSPGTGHTFVKKRASLSSSGCRKSLWDIVKGQLRDKRDKEQRCCVISTDQAKQAKEEKRPSTDWFSKYEKPATRDLNSKREIMSKPELLVEPDFELPLAFLDQKKAVKTLLLITNSDYHYTDKMMQHSFNRFLPNDMGGRDLFDMVGIKILLYVLLFILLHNFPVTLFLSSVML